MDAYYISGVCSITYDMYFDWISIKLGCVHGRQGCYIIWKLFQQKRALLKLHKRFFFRVN